MTSYDDRHVTPPTVGSRYGRRIRGRPRITTSSLTRRRRDSTEAAMPEQDKPASAGTRAPLAEWHAMSEPEYVLAWEQLRDWATWLVNRYRLTLEDRLPGCWAQHPELIEELWALRAWRNEAYGGDGSGQSAVYWHQALVTFLGHVSGWWAGGCRAGHTSSDTDLRPEQIRAWAESDPLGGIAHPLRPIASVASEAGADGVGTLSDINVLTAAQMLALTNAGLAHPHHDTVAAFTFYDGSWWAFDSSNDRTSDTAAMWYRADSDDLDSLLPSDAGKQSASDNPD